MSTELIERLARIDPHPVDAEPPAAAKDAAAVLNDIERRTGMDVKDRSRPSTTRPRRSNGLLVGAAAFVVVVIAGVALALATLSDDDEPPATIAPAPTTVAPTTSAAPTTTVESTTTLPPPTEVEAVAVAEAVFAAHAAGDAEGILGLMAPDALYAWFSAPQEDFRAAFARNVASEVTMTNTGCEVLYGTRIEGALVRCPFDVHLYVARAVGAPPVQAELELLVDGSGETSTFSISINGFQRLEAAFGSWMEENHPDDAEAAGCCGGETFEESIARGELRVFYADLWAAYLDENGCVWDQPGNP